MPNDAVIVHSPETIAEMEADEAFADEMKSVSSALRQAVHALQTGKYETFEDAMEAICGFRPVMVECNDEIDPVNWSSISIRHAATSLSTTGEDADD